jgi:hypothetical protein
VPDEPPTVPPSGALDVPRTIRAMLDSMDPAPGFVVGPAGDVLAWNQSWSVIATGLGLFDGMTGPAPNVARYTFTHPVARSAFPHWPTVADEEVARLRFVTALWPHQPDVAALVEELRQHQEFETRWTAHRIGRRHRGARRIAHPDAGTLDVDYEVLNVADDGLLELVAWIPADAATAERIRSLNGAPRLRLVDR